MSIAEIINEAAQAAWEAYHGPIDDDGYIPQMPPAFMRGFLCGVAWATKSQYPPATEEPEPES